ncbi:four helix bundle protein [Vibrio navarrensis]|uniref:four helix bundle protein n=1 Tax=Vibrio navarrensis TaxID=29495 RepID=UPI00051D3372|nr:four helix bundle protein [Vibrio navarrensis]KGK16164.1 S23 ribosomal protein [Vibrio navarrensis]
MKYQELKAWQESFELAIRVHRIFKDNKDFVFRDQIRRSAISVPSNIAEGEERETTKESVRFLYIAKGSCGELVTQLLLAKEFGYFDDSEASELIALATRVSRMIASLIKYRAGVVKDNRGTYLIEHDLEEQRVLEEQRALGPRKSRF